MITLAEEVYKVDFEACGNMAIRDTAAITSWPPP